MPTVTDLDNKTIKWKLKGKEVYKDYRPRSNLHKHARSILRDRFPTMQILEEVSIPVRKGKTLFLDFYIPLRKLAIEVHGIQHYQYNTMFHKSRGDFLTQKRNDRDKKEWCDINGIEFIVLPFNEMDEWDYYFND